MVTPERNGEAVIIDRFDYRGFFGRPAWCGLEVIPLEDGRTVVIATELEDNPGTSVTSVAEHLASHVCDRFGIDPDRLVWVEHYVYPSATRPGEPRAFEMVNFRRLPPPAIRWLEAVLRHHPSGWPGFFEDPEWRPMGDRDWQALGLLSREPVAYQPQKGVNGVK